MDLNTTEKKENNLLERTEIKGTITFTGPTPSYPHIKQALAVHLKVTEDVIAIKQVLTTFGASTATFSANIYKTAEQLTKIEPKVKVKPKPNSVGQGTAEQVQLVKENKTEEKK